MVGVGVMVGFAGFGVAISAVAVGESGVGEGWRAGLQASKARQDTKLIIHWKILPHRICLDFAKGDYSLNLV